MGWATQLPNLQARIVAAIGGEAATDLAESVETSEPKTEPKLSLQARSWAADSKQSPSVTHNNVPPPTPPLHDDPNLKFSPPKEPLPEAPVRGHYLGNPDWPTIWQTA